MPYTETDWRRDVDADLAKRGHQPATDAEAAAMWAGFNAPHNAAYFIECDREKDRLGIGGGRYRTDRESDGVRV